MLKGYNHQSAKSLHCQVCHIKLWACGPEACHSATFQQASDELDVPAGSAFFVISGYILRLSSSCSHFDWTLLFPSSPFKAFL